MRIEKINKIYHNQNKQVHALKDVSVDFIAQGICFIVGKSGSGKSTLLKILAGLDKDYTGSVKGFDGAYYVSSGYDLLSQLTVKQNLSLTRVSEKKTIKALQRYHLSDCENKKVKLLSNGEKRRVCRESGYLIQNLIKIIKLFKPSGLYNMTMRVKLYGPFLYKKKGRTQHLTSVSSFTQQCFR